MNEDVGSRWNDRCSNGPLKGTGNPTDYPDLSGSIQDTEGSVAADWIMCKVCGERYPESSEDDALIHVNNEHSIPEQLSVLVAPVNEQYSIPMRKQLFDSEYDARTYVMRDVSRMERVSALLTSCFGPAEDLMKGATYEGP